MSMASDQYWTWSRERIVQNWPTCMKFGKDVECFQFLRALKPMIICNGIPIRPLWTLDHTEHGDTVKGL